MGTRRLALGLALLTAPAAWGSESLTLCFRNELLVQPSVLGYARHALKRYESDLGVKLRFTCREPNSVTITFQNAPQNGRPADALGAARVHQGQVLPEIEIYRQSIRELFREIDPLLEGRALATVAAHELHHYLRQQRAHTASGLHGEFLTARNLRLGFR